MSRRLMIVGVLVGTLVLGFQVGPSAAARPPLTIRGGMNGAQEVPGPGDPDGSGSYMLRFTTLNTTTTRLCSALRVQGIDAPTAAHIHGAARHVAGNVVVHLPLTLSNGTYGGCQDLATSTLQPIMSNPRAYYVNVHNSSFPNGAVRGQLHPVG